MIEKQPDACDNVNTLTNVLRHLGYEVTATACARVPFVTFLDPLTGTLCDLVMDQPMGVLNSELLETYGQTDDRFMPL